jgi:CcmD family protein
MIRKCLHRFFYSLACLLFLMPELYAQNNDGDFLRSTGKIYSVVVAIVIIFLAISVYLWRIDNKLTKLENNTKDEHKTS